MKLAQLLTIALLLTSANAFAQPNPIEAPMVAPKPKLAPLDGANWSAIRVNNVPPSIIAWQLDQKHNAMPTFFNVPYAPPMEYAAEYKAPPQTKGTFDLADETRLVASDEQNLLFVSGGDAQQIAKVRELVSILDKPLRKIEFGAQLVELPAAELKQFDIDFPAQKDGTKAILGSIQVGLVRNDFHKPLDEMVADGTAKVVSTTPLTLTNNMGQAVSLLSGPIDNTGANQNKRPAAPDSGTDAILTLTPTINGDDTISLLMNLATLSATAEQSHLTTIVNLRDGETIALMGLKSWVLPTQLNPLSLNQIPLIGRLFRSKTIEADHAILIFVTARIVHTDAK